MAEGVLLDFTLSTGLEQRVITQNNKAALFGTLDTLAKTEGCLAVYWGLQPETRTRLVLVAAFDGPTGRSKLPLDRLLPFLAAPPRIFDIVILSPLSFLDTSTEITIHLARCKTNHGCRLQYQSQHPLAGHRETLVKSVSDEEDWVDFQAANKWSIEIEVPTPESKPSNEWLETRTRILHGKKIPRPLVSRSHLAGSVSFTLTPHKYQLPSATSYYHYYNGLKNSTKDQSLDDTFNSQHAEEMADDDGWVFVI